MIQEWYTARELAEMTLPNMPSTLIGMRKRADAESWKNRPRQASGGGREYHISNLSDEAQMALVEKLIGTAHIDALRNSNIICADDKQPEIPKITNEDRRNARVVILALFDKMVESSGLGVMRSIGSFIKLYHKEGSDPNSTYVPNWVYEIYPEVSERTLRRWRAAKKESRLKVRYGHRRKTGVLDRAHDGEVAQYIIALIAKKTHLTGGHVRDLVRSKFGSALDVNGEAKPLPNVRTFERFIYNWKSENGDLWLKLSDPDGAKNKHMVAFGKADAGIERLNQKWEIDASPVDALCVDGRYNLYAIIDVWSRRSLFLVSKTPKTEASLALIRRAIMEWGVPEIIKTDNGSDFTSKRFQTALLSLGIEQSLCTPYSPEQKPFVERVIQTLQHDIMPLMPGFVGHSVADRKKIEATKAFSVRLGESDKEAFAIQMTHEELQHYIDNWTFNKYAQSRHSSLNTTPFQKAASWTGAIRKIENERALDLLLAPIASGDGWRQVTKTGVRVENATFIAPELALYIGKQVFVRFDPRDMGKLWIFDDKERFICEAVNPERSGIDREHIASMAKAKQKQRFKEETKEIRRIQRGIKPEDMINDYLREHIESAENVTTFPRPETQHTTPALSEASKATRPQSIPESKPLTERQAAIQEQELQKFNEKLRERAQGGPPVDLYDKTDKEGRKRLMMKLEKRLEEGQRISSDNMKWLEGYRKTPECRSHKKIMESFGSTWFTKGDSK